MVQVLQKKLHQISLFHEIRYQEPTETMESNKSILLMISLLFFKESKASIPELIPLILWFMNQLFDQLNWAEKPYMWLWSTELSRKTLHVACLHCLHHIHSKSYWLQDRVHARLLNDHRSGRMLSLNSYPNFMGPGQHPNIFAADAEKRVLRRVSGIPGLSLPPNCSPNLGE